MDEKSTIYFLKTIVFFMPECFGRNWEVEVENVIIPIEEQFWERKEWGNETAGAQDLSWNQRADTLD